MSYRRDYSVLKDLEEKQIGGASGLEHIKARERLKAVIHGSFRLAHLLRISRHRPSSLNNRVSKSLQAVFHTVLKGSSG